MIHLYMFAFLLLVNVSAIYSTSQEADCSCSLYMDSSGFGKCKKPFAQLNSNFVCFVNEPTTCSDSHAIGSNPVRYLSVEACKESYDTDRDNNGHLTDEDFSNAVNAEFNLPPNTSDVFDQDLFEGDIELDGIGDVTNITKRKWPKADDGYVYIPISFPTTASVKEKAAIARTIIEFANKTCIRLRPFNATTDLDYIHINTRGFGCQSPIGRKGGPQVIRAHDCINNGGSWGRICHEVMHSIGFVHEHSRPDRDDYVSILWDELKTIEREDFSFRIERNYEKCSSCTTFGRYDLSSIMHYPSAFGRKNRTVIEPKDGACPNGEECIMGQRTGLSKLDAEDIQQFYQCDLKFSQHEEQLSEKMEEQKTELCTYIDCSQQKARELCPETCNRDITCPQRASNLDMHEFLPKFYNMYGDEILRHLSASAQKGEQGQPGENGSDGNHGIPGIPGGYGPQGLPGKKGDNGEKGSIGNLGSSGQRGSIGPRGPPGISGPPGVTGPKGADRKQACPLYKNITDSWRKITRNPAYSGSINCDQQNSAFDGSTWFRFVEPAGTILSTVDVKAQYSPMICGTYRTSWMQGDHPTRHGQVLSRYIRWSYAGNENHGGSTTIIKVAACVESNQNMFYLYKLKKAPTCNNAYCAI